MSYVLGGVTLPTPKGLARRVAEKSTYHDMINGTSKKDITARKEIFTLTFTRLSQTDASTIKALFAQKQTLLFSVSDGSLSISERYVHMDISAVGYNTKGSEYREDIVVQLTDVNETL